MKIGLLLPNLKCNYYYYLFIVKNQSKLSKNWLENWWKMVRKMSLKWVEIDQKLVKNWLKMTHNSLIKIWKLGYYYPIKYVFIIIHLSLSIIYFLIFSGLKDNENHLEVGHDPADGGVDHVDGGDVGAVLAVGALQRRRRTVEHVFRVAHAILCRLELSAERRRVLKLFHAAVLSYRSHHIHSYLSIFLFIYKVWVYYYYIIFRERKNMQKRVRQPTIIWQYKH